MTIFKINVDFGLNNSENLTNMIFETMESDIDECIYQLGNYNKSNISTKDDFEINAEYLVSKLEDIAYDEVRSLFIQILAKLNSQMIKDPDLVNSIKQIVKTDEFDIDYFATSKKCEVSIEFDKDINDILKFSESSDINDIEAKFDRAAESFAKNVLAEKAESNVNSDTQTFICDMLREDLLSLPIFADLMTDKLYYELQSSVLKNQHIFDPSDIIIDEVDVLTDLLD